MTFTRTIENFTCGHCDRAAKGNGYTNHCPACLWSKHVDNDPGDRAAACHGLMEPVRVEGTIERLRIVHRCRACGAEKRVDTAPEDSRDALIALAEFNS